MLQTAVNRYKQVLVQTSSPGQILIALYDGIFRFLNGAKACLVKKELPRARELLSKCQAIIHELEIALDHDVSPELCTDRIQSARIKADPAMIDDVLRVLTPLREAWPVAVAEVQKQGAANRSK
jgi:flagellar protein FliS